MYGLQTIRFAGRNRRHLQIKENARIYLHFSTCQSMSFTTLLFNINLSIIFNKCVDYLFHGLKN